MKSLEELYSRAMELKNKGMSDKEISTELHLSVNTITWLLSKDLKGSRVSDTKIGWRSIGVFGNRIEKIAEIMADIVVEEVPYPTCPYSSVPLPCCIILQDFS